MRRFATVTVLTLALAAPALAQTPTPTAPPPAAPAAVPEAMPFDVPYGAPIGMDDANKAIMAAVTEAKKHNWKMSITVVDPAGNLVAHATMDGTQYASIKISQAKARTAALFRRPSKVFADGINGANGAPTPGTLSLLSFDGGAASEGGFPIIKDGKLIGAIGASGGLAPQDGMTAKAGLTGLGFGG